VLSLRLLIFPPLVKTFLLLKLTKLVQQPKHTPDGEADILKQAMRKCEVWANKAYFAVKEDGSLRRRYFGTNSAKHIESIQQTFDAIENACDLTKDNIPFRCERSAKECEHRPTAILSAYVIPGKDRVYLCPDFFDLDLTDVDYNARTLIQELSHLDSSELGPRIKCYYHI
ncbi:hypothetical protein PoMZ_09016, partial [Pyricularia oryzae]